jgi:acyl-coenzyme A thioesterase PaaI-like protein
MMTRSMHPLIRHAPDPDHPGWWTWDMDGPRRYNATLGKLLVQADGPGRARCRMFPDVPHSNLGGVVHGGAILTFVDMAMFAGGSMAGAEVAFGVTLDLQSQFISAAELGVPLDATVELLRETGRLAFLRGLVEQEGRTVAAWSGTLRKGRAPQ